MDGGLSLSSLQCSPSAQLDLPPPTAHPHHHTIPAAVMAAARKPTNEELLLLTELNAYCVSDSFSEQGLQEIIRRNGFTPNNNILSDYTFFYRVCQNTKVADGIKLILKYFPGASRSLDKDHQPPLHIACRNKNVTPEIIRTLIQSHPDSLTTKNIHDRTVLHHLCVNNGLDNTAAIKILVLLLKNLDEKIIQHADERGNLPIHFAAGSGYKSPEFCEKLIEAHPGSDRVVSLNGALPLHFACTNGTAATTEYLCKLYPGGINHNSYTISQYGKPIHHAIGRLVRSREDSETAVQIVQIILNQNDFQKGDMALLFWTFAGQHHTSNRNAGLRVIKLLFDAYPESIKEFNTIERINRRIERCQDDIRQFLYCQLSLAFQADQRYTCNSNPDQDGQLPIHKALKDKNVALGSIKLMVQNNPDALRAHDIQGLIPFHLACHHHASTAVIQYLIDKDTTTLSIVDFKGNAAFHHACRSANYEAINLILEKYDAVSVSNRNSDGMLPIELLLLESNSAVNRNGTEYVESIFNLVRAHPQTLMDWCGKLQRTSAESPSPSLKGSNFRQQSQAKP